MEGNSVRLEWEDHVFHLMQGFEQLRREELHTDVALICSAFSNDGGDGNDDDDDRQFESPKLGDFNLLNRKTKFRNVKAHKLALSLSSPMLHDVFAEDEDCDSVILPEEVGEKEVDYLLEFVYKGRVQVSANDVNSVLRAARLLQIKGLEGGGSGGGVRSAFSRKRFSKRKSPPKKVTTKSDFREGSPERIEALPLGEEEEEDVDEADEDGQPSAKRGKSFEDAFLMHAAAAAAPNVKSDFSLIGLNVMNDSGGGCGVNRGWSSLSRTYTKEDMEKALDALRERRLSLTRASEAFGIPATTLWQRANRMGISTPKKETTNKTWSDDDMNRAVDALRNRQISANKAAKMYKIPSSTLYKIARKLKIELAQPFNAVATSWKKDDLQQALQAIKAGTPVLKAAAQFGIPSGTLYGRCKKVGIELSKTTTVHWSEEAMKKALVSVRSRGMSINQAAIHHNLPYSSLYGRINRWKREKEELTSSAATPIAGSSSSETDNCEVAAARSQAVVRAAQQQQQQLKWSGGGISKMPFIHSSAPVATLGSHPSLATFMMPYLTNFMAARHRSINSAAPRATVLGTCAMLPKPGDQK